MKSPSSSTSSSIRLHITFLFILTISIAIVFATTSKENQKFFQFQHNHRNPLTTTTEQPLKMSKQFLDALASRHSYYALKAASPIADGEIQSILKRALTVVPSSFNSQTTRMLLLLHDDHRTLWSSTLDLLESMGKANDQTRTKMGGFGNAYGTVLFFEEQDIVDGLMANVPSYADKFPQWSEHANAMHQLAVWTALKQEGLGANLQHYNPLIDGMVQKNWGIKESWKLKAQMVFGTPAVEPSPKDNSQKPTAEERLVVFGQRLPN